MPVTYAQEKLKQDLLHEKTYKGRISMLDKNHLNASFVGMVPAAMEKMMTSKDKNKVARVTQAFLKMKKFDIAELERAYEGK